MTDLRFGSGVLCGINLGLQTIDARHQYTRKGLMVEQLHSVSDDDGYRPNVGIVLFNSTGQVLWARRSRHDGWQFPQGGIEQGETVEQAAYRELYEEVGLRPQNVELVGRTRNWLRYDVPGSLRSRCLLYTSPSPRDQRGSRMPSSA